MSKKTIYYGGIEFEIIDNTLIKMLNRGEERDVFIPAVFPSGECIVSISERFCYGPFSTITIDNGISVRHEAFRSANVNTVVWPSSCKKIPLECFFYSAVSKVINIDDVEYIDDGAFEGSSIQQFVWPAKCKKIPRRCFLCSSLVSITGMENVDIIGHLAFAKTDLKSFNWPPKCKTIPEFCFYESQIKSISGIENVNKVKEQAFAESGIEELSWPASCVNVPQRCFRNCKNLKTLDFSHHLTALNVNPTAVEDSDNVKIYYPYYAID